MIPKNLFWGSGSVLINITRHLREPNSKFKADRHRFIPLEFCCYRSAIKIVLMFKSQLDPGSSLFLTKLLQISFIWLEDHLSILQLFSIEILGFYESGKYLLRTVIGPITTL